MNEIKYDYKYAWRWLLPVASCRQVCMLGYSTEEIMYWRKFLGQYMVTNKPNNADAIIVNTDIVSLADKCMSIPIENLQMACVNTTTSRMKPWRKLFVNNKFTIREYILMPSGKPRVVIPRGSPEMMKAVLMIHRPGHIILRIALWIIRKMIRYGIKIHLGGRILMIAVRDPKASPMGAVNAGDAKIYAHGMYALYLGTPDDNRKTVALPIYELPPRKIMKTAETLRARRSLVNEEKVLAFLAKMSISGNVPTILGKCVRKNAYTVYLEYRQRKNTWPGVMKREIEEFLTNLTKMGRHKILFKHALMKYSKIDVRKYPVACNALNSIIFKVRESCVIWEHRSHGDFAPWNCSWTDKGLFVYDWEESAKRDVAFGDAFYYITAPAIHVERFPNADKVLRKALYMANRVSQKAAIEGVNMKAQFALWAIARLNKHPFYSKLLESLAKV